MEIKIKKLSPNAIIPKYATTGSAGMDLCALIDSPILIKKGDRKLIPTGISVSVSEGFASFIYARSSLAIKHGICLANSVGVIDSDYTGEIKVGIINLGNEDYEIKPNERIAQLVVSPVCVCEIKEVLELEKTQRGDGGFGSTGKF